MTEASSSPPKQQWNPYSYAKNAGFVATLGSDVLKLLAPQPNERILDLGCGDGVLTERIMQLGANVLGVDASAEMIDATQRRGISAQIVDAQKLTFQQEFDAVFSNAALHWMLDPQAVITGVKTALKPGGRFVAEFGGHGNVAAICTALIASLTAHRISLEGRHPWYFPTPEAYRNLLQKEGFQVHTIELIPRPTPLPTGINGWLNTFAAPFLHGLDEAIKADILTMTVDLLAYSLKDENGDWSADYVRLRVFASL